METEVLLLVDQGEDRVKIDPLQWRNHVMEVRLDWTRRAEVFHYAIVRNAAAAFALPASASQPSGRSPLSGRR